MGRWVQTGDAYGEMSYLNDDGTYTDKAPDGSGPPGTNPQPYYPDAGAGVSAPAEPVVPPPGSGAGPSVVVTGQNQSTSKSYTGTPQVARDAFHTGLGAASQGAEQMGQAGLDAAVQPLADATQAQGRSVIGDEAYRGAPSQYDVQAQIAEVNARAASRLAEIQMKQRIAEQAAQVAAEAQVDKAGAEYMSSVQQFAGMRVNPGAWWGNLSGSEQVGTLAAVFTAGFLGMQGRNIPVMDIINRAIDQNMTSQSLNIEHAGDVAREYKNVYDMVVAQSASREEARARMRGYYLAQVQQEVLAELSRYDAPLAQAKMAESRALLDKEFAKTKAELHGMWTDRVLSAKELAVRQYSAELNSAQVSSSTSQSTGYSGQAMVPTGADEKYANVDWAMDPLTRKPYGKFLPNVGEAAKKEVRDKTANVRSLSRKVNQLVQLLDKTNGAVWQGPFQAQIDSETDKQIRALQADIAQEYMKAVQGSRPSDFDFKAALERTTPIPGVTSRADVTEVLYDLERRANEAFKDTSSVYVIGFTSPEEMAYADSIRSADAGPAEDMLAETRAGAPADTDADKAIQAIRSPGSNEPADEYSKNAEVAWIGTVHGVDNNAPVPPVPEWFAEGWSRAKKIKKNPQEAAKFDAYLEAYAQEAANDPVRTMAVKILRGELGVQVQGLNTDYNPDVQGPLVPIVPVSTPE